MRNNSKNTDEKQLCVLRQGQIVTTDEKWLVRTLMNGHLSLVTPWLEKWIIRATDEKQ